MPIVDHSIYGCVVAVLKEECYVKRRTTHCWKTLIRRVRQRKCGVHPGK